MHSKDKNGNELILKDIKDINNKINKAGLTFGIKEESLSFNATSGYQGFDIPLNHLKSHVDIEDKDIIDIDNKFIVDKKNHTVKIGKGISKVKISANTHFYRTKGEFVSGYITKNDVNIIRAGTATRDYNNISVVMTPMIIDVKEGDVFKLRFSTGSGESGTWTCLNANISIYLTIEEV